MKHLSASLIISLFTLLSYGQNNRQTVYYLADTIGVSPSNNILTIQREGPVDTYVFHCRCISANNSYPVCFVYSLNNAKSETFQKLPNYKYLSWRELEGLLYEKQQNFNRFYVLEIVEKLPNNTYKKNKVRLFIAPKQDDPTHSAKTRE